MTERYARSEELLRRSRAVVPGGAQTFSKSATQFPPGVSPLFLERGKGSRVWDVDGNEYVDFVNALCALTLGYGDPDVDRAVAAQLERGVSFSLSHPLEIEVAERLVQRIPCAQAVRFCKNGSDATAAAVRVARAFTGREHVAVCGYHGWHDWTIGRTTRDRGVPACTKELTHVFAYNDAGSLSDLFERLPGRIAAVVLEPMSTTPPEPGFLEALREACRAAGALLVFDEIVSGFRFARGGAQELFGVTPDMATFGKGLANGYPLACVTGRADVMALFEEVFFSTTFAGETLSLAAARAVLDKLDREPVLETLHARGTAVLAATRRAIADHRLQDVLSIEGHPSWTVLAFSRLDGTTDWDLKTLYLQECFARGILTLGSHNMSYAHDQADLERLSTAYDEVFAGLRSALDQGRVREHLRCEPLVPLFQVRATRP